MATHLGRNPQDHVTLELIGGVNGGFGPHEFDWQRNLPDGTSGGIFRIRNGQVLVVTDVDWSYNSGTPGSRQQMRLFVVPFSDPTNGLRQFESTIILGATGDGGASDAMTSGFLVSSAAQIGIDVFPGPVSAGTDGTLNHAILRGYLTTTRAPRPIK